MDAVKIKKMVAKTIKKADKSYFFEDYGKQAGAVINMLKREGLVIVPREASEDMCEFAAENMTTGRMKPEQHVGHVWRTMIEFASRRKN
ncbi:MAG: hypothetical protein P8P30_09260 [Rickettsiales bacterium]|nr:hypothetical protein [Rickettsiales bacterium]